MIFFHQELMDGCGLIYSNIVLLYIVYIVYSKHVIREEEEMSLLQEEVVLNKDYKNT